MEHTTLLHAFSLILFEKIGSDVMTSTKIHAISTTAVSTLCAATLILYAPAANGAGSGSLGSSEQPQPVPACGGDAGKGQHIRLDLDSGSVSVRPYCVPPETAYAQDDVSGLPTSPLYKLIRLIESLFGN